MIKIPPYLKKGDTIGLTCPAGYMMREKAQVCIDTLQKWGFHVMVGKTLGSDSPTYFSGTDEERRNELQAMLDDDSIHAVLCGRGGYGVSRIIDDLDFSRFRKKPKWIIGYSDITVLHCHLNRRLKIASLHSPMAAAFNHGEDKNKYIGSLHKAITGRKATYKADPHPFNKIGNATAELVGGNLSLVANLIGTPSELVTENKILFLEDIGEQLYSIDRLFYQVKRSGKLDNLAGLIIGHFTEVRDTERPFGKGIDELILDIVKDYNYPICFGFPVSHDRENYALKVGCTYELKVGKKSVQLAEKTTIT
jgi:muramoyltetrapeptide carboxypeptidase